MTLIAVAGGTGLAGRAVVAEAVARGYRVRSLSRHLPSDEKRVAGAEYIRADFTTGAGVATGLESVDALIETLDARSGAALRALPVTSVAVLGAAAEAGIGRIVLLSIVRAGECKMAYYQAQAARALSYEHSGLATTVVYATQFHNLVAGIFAAGAKVGVIPVFKGVSFQPIATSDVARILVDAAVAQGQEKRKVLAGGPEVHGMKGLASQWKEAMGSRAVTLPVPLPGSFGGFLRAGKNLVPEAAEGTVTFRDWMASR